MRRTRRRIGGVGCWPEGAHPPVPRPIPIRNLYYMFLYAWDHFREGQALEVAATEGPEVLDLFAEVLIRGVRRLLRRGLDRGYLEAREETPAPRGRIVITETLKRASLVHGRAVCAYDELSTDVPHNRVLKATLRALAGAEGLDADLAHELLLLQRRLAGVSDLPLSHGLFRAVQLSRNNRHYDLLLRVCALALEGLLPGEGGRRTRFADVLEDEVRMSAVFEAFVRNFYRAEQDGFDVSADHLAWDAVCPDPRHAEFLPVMRTDLVLRSRSAGRIVVVDAKFWRQTLVGHHWGGAEKVRPAHLYQLLAYLRAIAPLPGGGPAPEGVLLYPRVGGDDLRLEFVIDGHRVRVWTIDLDRDWAAIHDDLLSLLAPPGSSLNAPGTSNHGRQAAQAPV